MGWTGSITRGFDLTATATCRQPLTGDGAITGQWVDECASENREGSYARYYSFTLESESEVTITLESEIDTWLYLLEGSGRTGTVRYDNDDIVSGNLDSQIRETLSTGSYTIEATTYDAGVTGSFTLTVSGLGTAVETGTEPTPSDSCVVALSGDQIITGQWVDECASENREGSYARYYSFTLESESEVTITLESEIDTWLYLLEGSGRTGTVRYDNDDIVSGNLDSQIRETLSTGSYTIEATTYDAGVTGSFTLTVSGLGTAVETGTEPTPSDSCVVALSGDQIITGQWVDECASENREGSYARYYSFTLESESEVTITLESEIDTWLYLLEGSGRTGTVRYDNDDIVSGNLDSQIRETLSAGSYTIEATTYDAGVTGSFTLTVSGLGTAVETGTEPTPSDSCVETISEDGTIEGEWAAGCQSAAIARGYARYYEFELAEEKEAAIWLVSTEADPYLFLREGEASAGETLLENDDEEAGGKNSRLVATLGPGAYTIEATTYEAEESGSFTLTVRGIGPASSDQPGPEVPDNTPASVKGSVDLSITGYTNYVTKVDVAPFFVDGRGAGAIDSYTVSANLGNVVNLDPQEITAADTELSIEGRSFNVPGITTRGTVITITAIDGVDADGGVVLPPDAEANPTKTIAFWVMESEPAAIAKGANDTAYAKVPDQDIYSDGHVTTVELAPYWDTGVGSGEIIGYNVTLDSFELSSESPEANTHPNVRVVDATASDDETNVGLDGRLTLQGLAELADGVTLSVTAVTATTGDQPTNLELDLKVTVKKSTPATAVGTVPDVTIPLPDMVTLNVSGYFNHGAGAGTIKGL